MTKLVTRLIAPLRAVGRALAKLSAPQMNAISGMIGTVLVGVGVGLVWSAGHGLVAAGGCLVFDELMTKWLSMRGRR